MVQTKEINKFKFGKYFAQHKVGLFFYAFIYLITGAIDIFATIKFACFSFSISILCFIFATSLSP